MFACECKEVFIQKIKSTETLFDSHLRLGVARIYFSASVFVLKPLELLLCFVNLIPNAKVLSPTT